MQIHVVKSKIHLLKVTQTDLHYDGSITLAEDMIEAAGLREFERVQVLNENNGERLETYVIKGERGSGVCCLNGPAARRAQVGDVLIVIGYAWMTPEEADKFTPTMVRPNPANNAVD